jgi:hypothetical protein
VEGVKSRRASVTFHFPKAIGEIISVGLLKELHKPSSNLPRATSLVFREWQDEIRKRLMSVLAIFLRKRGLTSV